MNRKLGVRDRVSLRWTGTLSVKGKADINNDIDINDNVSALNVVNKVEGYQIIIMVGQRRSTFSETYLSRNYHYKLNLNRRQ